MSTDPLYFFPSPPAPDAAEWPGTPIGQSNTITRTKGRTAVHDKTIDRLPGRLESLLAGVEGYRHSSRESPEYEHDVVIHGVRVRANTNSPHLYDFWVENWYSVDEWQKQTGLVPPGQPQIQVYAYSGVENQQEAAYYSRRQNTIAFFNTAYYGQLKSWVLGAVGRILAEEYGIHSVHGACVEVDGKGVLYIAPTGTGKSTSSYGLMQHPSARFHSDDWVYIRYVYPTKQGQQICPVAITNANSGEIKGSRVFRWLEKNASKNPRARVHGLGLDNDTIEIEVEDLDLSQPPQAYAYISEKIFYLRSNLVENFPSSTYELLHSKFENCPEVSPDFYAANGEVLGHLADSLDKQATPMMKQYFAKLGTEGVEEALARMMAFDNARAMLYIGNIFGEDKSFINPMEPTLLKTVFLLRRDFSENTVLEELSVEEFITRLLIGETPQGKHETAYNAYRAVDDNEERIFIDEILAESRIQNIHAYSIYRQNPNTPHTLLQEFELFRILHKSTNTYHLNTILRKDPQVIESRDAVRLTMDLIAHCITEQPREINLTLDNYRAYATGNFIPQAMSIDSDKT